MKPKAERPKRKAEAGKEEEHSAPDNYREGTPHSAIKELPTANSKLLRRSSLEKTKKMEVHHHPEVEKKGIKEYILEGLMIFIAVMMGFFAESLREHIADNSKENEYMRSMVQDLKADTAELSSCIRQFGTISSELDTMLLCLKSDKPDPLVISRIVSDHFWLYTGYSYNNRTVQQLKNSGVFRLVRNNNAAAAILKYDNFQNTIMLTQYVDLKNTMFAYKDMEARVMHYKDLDVTNSKSKAFKDFKPADFVADVKQPFVTSDKDAINYYYNKLFIHGALCHVFLQNIKYAKSEATKLITLIKKEYRLEDE